VADDRVEAARHREERGDRDSGALPPTTRDLKEFQRFTAELLSEVQAAKKAGQTAEAAAKSVNVTAKFKGYTSERLGAAIQAICAHLP
jgi:hypothetical protein